MLSLHVAASSLGGQSALRFKLPFGPHTVGFKTVDQYDYSRTFGGAYDEDGHPRAGERARAIQTSVWFPAAAGATAARMRYREYLELYTAPGSLPARDSAARRSAAHTVAFAFNPRDTVRLNRELDAVTHASRDASPARGAFPVIVYGASYNAPSFENATLMEFLASWGYVVVSSPSMGAQGGQTPDAVGIESEARDMEVLMAYARSLPDADISRLGVLGFSWGGIANVLVALRNPGVRAVASLDGSIAYFYKVAAIPGSPARPDFSTLPFVDPAHFTVPALFIKQRPASAEMIARSGASDTIFHFFHDIRYSDAYVVNLMTLGHQNFGEWFDRLKQSGDPSFVADTTVQSAGYERIAEYTRQFFDAYLKHSDEGKAFLARSPSQNGFPANEVVVQRKVGLRPLPTVASFAHELIVRHMRPADAPTFLAEVRATAADYVLDEAAVNAWGYRLLGAKESADAIGVFRINVTMYPKSSNAYDSLGDAQMRSGARALAIDSYQRSFDLDSTNTNATEMLKKLRAGGPPTRR
jgi:hypothetical protein